MATTYSTIPFGKCNAVEIIDNFIIGPSTLYNELDECNKKCILEVFEYNIGIYSNNTEDINKQKDNIRTILNINSKHNSIIGDINNSTELKIIHNIKDIYTYLVVINTEVIHIRSDIMPPLPILRCKIKSDKYITINNIIGSNIVFNDKNVGLIYNIQDDTALVFTYDIIFSLLNNFCMNKNFYKLNNDFYISKNKIYYTPECTRKKYEIIRINDLDINDLYIYYDKIHFDIHILSYILLLGYTKIDITFKDNKNTTDININLETYNEENSLIRLRKSEIYEFKEFKFTELSEELMEELDLIMNSLNYDFENEETDSKIIILTNPNKLVDYIHSKSPKTIADDDLNKLRNEALILKKVGNKNINKLTDLSEQDLNKKKFVFERPIYDSLENDERENLLKIVID